MSNDIQITVKITIEHCRISTPQSAIRWDANNWIALLCVKSNKAEAFAYQHKDGTLTRVMGSKALVNRINRDLLLS